MKTSLFDYNLPKRFIAQKPASPRDSSKMMVYDRRLDSLYHKNFYDLIDILGENDVLVVNQSKVIPARIIIKNEGKEQEIFLLRQLLNNAYRVLVRPGKAFLLNSRINLDEHTYGVVKEILEDGSRIIEFNDNIEKFGSVPFPPYIKNVDASESDYQTVYASQKGSVAAPTAGLHFTKELLRKLIIKGVKIEQVTLHVGRGTFLPVKSENIKDHKMHSERYELNEESAERLNNYKKQGKRIIAVGTTSVRVLESSYSQNKVFTAYKGETDIFIYPGYKWKAVDGLITNFHLPKSTLLMLVSSFIGSIEKMLDIYEIAKEKEYRFYSFGDCMLLL